MERQLRHIEHEHGHPQAVFGRADEANFQRSDQGKGSTRAGARHVHENSNTRCRQSSSVDIELARALRIE